MDFHKKKSQSPVYRKCALCLPAEEAEQRRRAPHPVRTVHIVLSRAKNSARVPWVSVVSLPRN